jgi:hypothetical protein
MERGLPFCSILEEEFGSHTYGEGHVGEDGEGVFGVCTVGRGEVAVTMDTVPDYAIGVARLRRY